MRKAEIKRLGDAPSINKLPRPDKGAKVYYDGYSAEPTNEDEAEQRIKHPVNGFGVRVTAGGARSYVLNYRTKGGRERRITIGNCDHWTVGEARKKARELKRTIEDGG